MKYFGLIWSNMWRKRIRTTLTILSVFVAFLLFGMLSAFKLAFDGSNASIENAERLISVHKVSLINFLPIAYVERVRNLPGVAGATHSTWFGAYYQESRNTFGQFPVDAESYLAIYPEFTLPPEQEKAWLSNRTGAVVGRAIADQFGFKVGDRVPLTSTIWTNMDGNKSWEFDIEGIFEDSSGNGNSVYMLFHYDYFEEARAFAKGQIGWIIEKGDGTRPNTELAADIDLMFANSSAETKTTDEAAFAEEYAKQFGNIALIVTAILGAVFFTILLVNGNTMAQSVRERIPELAVLKTLGFGPGSILGMVLVEGVLLALIGGVAGIVAAKWLLVVASKAMASTLPGGLTLNAQTVAWAVAFMFLVGMASGLLPAMQAMRLSIVQALARR